METALTINIPPSGRARAEKEERAKVHSERNVSYKDKFHKMRERYDKVTGAHEMHQRDLEIANAKIKKLQAENDLLLDAMFIGEPLLYDRFFPPQPETPSLRAHPPPLSSSSQLPPYPPPLPPAPPLARPPHSATSSHYPSHSKRRSGTTNPPPPTEDMRPPSSSSNMPPVEHDRSPPTRRSRRQSLMNGTGGSGSSNGHSNGARHRPMEPPQDIPMAIEQEDRKEDVLMDSNGHP